MLLGLRRITPFVLLASFVAAASTTTTQEMLQEGFLPFRMTHDKVFFCKVNIKEYKKQPNQFPMYKEMTDVLCRKKGSKKNSVSMSDLISWSESEGGKAAFAKIKGLVFHQSRCGSTLVANSKYCCLVCALRLRMNCGGNKQCAGIVAIPPVLHSFFPQHVFPFLQYCSLGGN